MLFNHATSLTLALIALINVSVMANRDLLVREIDTPAKSKVSELEIVEMPCVGEARGRTAKCVRPDKLWWGCEDGLVCVMKNEKAGKCMRLDDNIPTDSPDWLKKNKAVTCASRDSNEPPISESNVGGNNKSGGDNCSADTDDCICAGGLWKCGDVCNMISRACDEGFQCWRKRGNKYAVCSNAETWTHRGLEHEYTREGKTFAEGGTPDIVPCGVDIGHWNIPEGTKPFTPGTPTGSNADRCQKEAQKHLDHGHDTHGIDVNLRRLQSSRKLSTFPPAVARGPDMSRWEDEQEWLDFTEDWFKNQ